MNKELLTNRRMFLASGAALSSMALLPGRAHAQDVFPVVETAQGKLRGAHIGGGVVRFLGVRYAQETSGKNRFMPPKPLKPWRGVKDALHYSHVSPQTPNGRSFDYGDLIVFDRHPSGIGEDCLAINIWTPNLDKSAKKPVIVSLHGGGFYGGSGNSFGMDGDRMARYGDVVVISVNHRLGAFGYAHLGEWDDRFARSGAVGMMDIVAVLQWINENVEQFGGDPSRVMVFGQSGGGAKTSTLLGMPAAKGLVHRAGVMSGSKLTVTPKDRAAEISERLLDALEITTKDVHKIQKVPFTQILEAQVKLEAVDRAKGEAPGSFGPVMDGVAIPDHPFDPAATPLANDVPMVISTALDERTYRMPAWDLSEADLMTYLTRRAGDRAAEALALYKAEDPDAGPNLIRARADSDLSFRRGAFLQAERKAKQASEGGAPCWTYLWTWPSPAYSGRYGATHGIDVGLSLHSTRGGLTGTGPVALKMADRIASSWAAFAATGNPNNGEIPDWPAYTQGDRATMIFDEEMRVANDPRADIRAFWDEARQG